MRYDIVSDTHGYLSEELLDALKGADVIVHAGDMCSTEHFRALEKIAPVKMCLGNNDWGFDYGPFVNRVARFYSEGHRFQVCHYRQGLDLEVCDIAICGHTHKPLVEKDERTGVLIMNPGSPTYPRAGGASMGRIVIEDDQVVSAEIIQLGPKKSLL